MGLRILGNAKSESKRLSPLVERVRESGTRRLSRGVLSGKGWAAVACAPAPGGDEPVGPQVQAPSSHFPRSTSGGGVSVQGNDTPTLTARPADFPPGFGRLSP